MSLEPTVFVVDDDEQARASVCALIRSMGVKSKGFESAEAFLEEFQQDVPGCIVTDLRLTGRSGVDLQEDLLRNGFQIPLIVLTGFARTPVTVRAMRNGAVTMLDKPYSDDELSDAIRNALRRDQEQWSARVRRAEIRARIKQLSESERQVMQMMVEGAPNKLIATRLDVSERTVENRRHEVFAKLQANSVAELVRLVIEANDR